MVLFAMGLAPQPTVDHYWKKPEKTHGMYGNLFHTYYRETNSGRSTKLYIVILKQLSICLTKDIKSTPSSFLWHDVINYTYTQILEVISAFNSR
jgi:hypothetical protein